MKTQALHRVLSMLVTVAMVLNIGLTPVFAAEGVTPPGVSGVCTHHTEHTEDCGYQQGTPCTHEHKVNDGEADREGPLGGTDDCYKVELTCKLIEGDAPEIATDSEATLDSGTAHTHGDSCYTKIDNCKHTHDDTCGYTPDSPCTYDTASCTQCSPGDKPAEKVCTCEPAISASDAGHDEDCPLYTKPVCTCPPVDSGEQIHGKGCPLYTTPALSEAVKTLIAMVDALPNAEDITEDNKEATLPAFDAALTAYEALSDDDKAAFVTTKQYAKLWALYTALYPFALMTNEVTWDMKDGTLTLDSNCGSDCTHTVTGTSTSGKISVTGGTHNITLKDASIQLSDADTAAFSVEGSSTVNLTLEGTNVLKSGARAAGLQVTTGNTLTITNASTGSLSATGGLFSAGIGGGQSGAGGSIIISGGTVTGTGDKYGAGIGGGYNGAGGTITISGGSVTGTGGDLGAGIGGGRGGTGGEITISGGTVTGTGGSCGAGIGGGSNGAGGKITISGGTINATGGDNSASNGGGAGIGGGNIGAGGEITISGGTVTGKGGLYSAGIGGGDMGTGGNIAISGHAVVFAAKGTDAPNHIGAGSSDGAGTVTRSGGIIFEGEIGAVYGSVTLGQALTIAPEKTLTINSDNVLEVGSGVTFTNNGTINNLGTITNKGTLSGNGSLTGGGVVQTALTGSMISLDQDSYVYTGSAFEPTVTVATPWTGVSPFAKDTDFTVGYTANTVAGTATVTVTPKGSNLTGSPVNKTFTITQSDTAFTGGIKTYKDTNEQSTFTYGDTITVKVTVAATGTAPAPRSRAVPTANQMALFKGNVQLTDPQAVISGTELTFTIATTDKQLAIGENAITAKYVESTNMAGHEQTITVTLNKKPLTGGTITAGQSKPYDGNNRFSGIAATFAPADGVLDGDAVTATIGGTTSSSAVGTSLPLTVTSATLGAADAGFYLPPTNLTTITGNVGITAIAPVYNVADQKIKIDRTLTEIQAAKAATGVNNETVAGTLTWAESSGGNALTNSYAFTGNAGDTKTLYWTFAPTSGNYKTLSGSTVFTLTSKEVPVLTINNIEKTYDGKAVTTVTGTAKVGEAPVAGTFVFDGTPPTMQDAKLYNATVKFTPTDSVIYDVATISITVTIRKATVEIAAALSEPQIVAGGTLPTPGIRYDGLVSGESLTPATTATFAGMPSSSTKGTYTITWSNKAAMQAEIEALAAYKNYTASYKDSVTLQISERSGGGSTGSSSGGSGGGGGGSSSGGNSSDSSILTPKDTTSKPNPSTTVESNVTGKTDGNGKATAAVEDRTITNAIDKAQKEAQKNGTDKNAIRIALNVKTDKNATSLEVTLSKTSIDALIKAGATELTVKNALTTLTFDLAALKALAGGNVILAISKVDVKTLSAEAQNVIGNRPVFRFGATVGGKAVTDFRGSRVGLQMPYIRSTTKQAGNLCAVYVDGNGKLTWLENSSYESITGMMLASTSHFSIYGVGYKQSTPKFTDVGTHWAKNDIDFVVARGLLNGTSNTTFAPDQAITRGELQSALEKLSGKGLSAVIGGKSADTITRQDLAVLLVNYSKAIGYKLPSVHAVVTFTDASNIASWAKDAVGQMQMAGILMGKSGNRFDPTATATRAEVSAMIRRFVELMVNTETAEGWAMNDSGQWMYIENGKRTTGKKTVGGTQYTFDQYGVSTALPPERKYLTHIV